MGTWKYYSEDLILGKIFEKEMSLWLEKQSEKIYGVVQDTGMVSPAVDAKVSNGHVFVVGGNRHRSNDSRFKSNTNYNTTLVFASPKYDGCLVFSILTVKLCSQGILNPFTSGC